MSSNHPLQRKDRSEPKATIPAEKDSGYSKCSHSPSDSGRNLVICIDGTANQLGNKNTNVVELYSILKKNNQQLTYYTSGIGTYAKPPGFFNQIVDLAFARNFEKIVLSAYRWLSERYQDDDKIFIFGFSRGAYQARVLAGMIETVGLLPEGNNDQIPFAYDLYESFHKYNSSTRKKKRNSNIDETGSSEKRLDRDQTAGTTQETSKSQAEDEHDLSWKEKCDLFKNTLAREHIKVHFVGAWDTVSSVGVGRKPLPETTSGMTHVCAFRHALALDERRVKYLPEYVNGGEGPSEPSKGDVKEVWFAGSHSDIGGGNVPNKGLNKFGPALRWMAHEAWSHGLRIEHRANQWESPGQALTTNDSMTWGWKLLEILPLQRLRYKGQHSSTRRPHLQKSRVVLSGQKIHQSVRDDIVRRADEATPSYVPTARVSLQITKRDEDLPLDISEWEKLFQEHHNLVEEDFYASAESTLDALKPSPDGMPAELVDDPYRMLVAMTSSDIGRRSLTETPEALNVILATLDAYQKKWKSDNNSLTSKDQNIIKGLVKTLSAFPPQSRFKRTERGKIRNLLSLAPPINAKDQSTIFRNIAYAPFQTEGLTVAWSVTFSPDNARIISGCTDGTIRVWDAKTGDAVMEPLEGHDDDVLSVAFSPDGTRIVSGSADQTIRLWDVQTGDEVVQLKGHNDWVRSVAFSPNGTGIVSGSADQTIRLWDAQTGEEVKKLMGHNDWVRSVAFSPDGTRIVSGSDYWMIRLWDAQTGEEVKQLKGHDGLVLSVAFSPDGTRFVSGSADQTIRLWDAQTGEEVKKLMGHNDWIRSVAFSPDGTRIVSGSDDGTIRLWDAQTGDEVKQLKGHDNSVISVAFSPDGTTRIVSSSFDRTIRVWDAQTGEQLLGPDEESD